MYKEGRDASKEELRKLDDCDMDNLVLVHYALQRK